MDEEEKLYFDYLKGMVRNHISDDYEKLLEKLWNKEYYSILPNDQNRERDGLLLRVWLGEREKVGIFGPCRVLEMLIALSKRMEFEIQNTGYNEDYVDLFWEMLDNLGLLIFDNLNVIKDMENLEIDHILTSWIEREYRSNGVGGIFPIHNWQRGRHKMQHRIETWYQMMTYLEENYPI